MLLTLVSWARRRWPIGQEHVFYNPDSLICVPKSVICFIFRAKFWSQGSFSCTPCSAKGNVYSHSTNIYIISILTYEFWSLWFPNRLLGILKFFFKDWKSAQFMCKRHVAWAFRFTHLRYGEIGLCKCVWSHQPKETIQRALFIHIIYAIG